MITKSPSGSACPYYYRGGELHPLHYGSCHGDHERLFGVMRAEEDFILKASGQHNRRIWIDLYETELDSTVAEALARHIEAIEPKIFRLCLVGCDARGRRRLSAKLKERLPALAGQVRFFDDPEEAKQWLVGEKA